MISPTNPSFILSRININLRSNGPVGEKPSLKQASLNLPFDVPLQLKSFFLIFFFISYLMSALFKEEWWIKRD